MPLIEIKVFEDEFSDEQCAGIIGAVTDTMVTFGALGPTDVRALQAPSLTPSERSTTGVASRTPT